MKCIKCGFDNLDGIDSCRSCGYDFTTLNTQVNSNTNKKSNTSKIVVIVIICLLVVLLLGAGVVGGIYFFTRNIIEDNEVQDVVEKDDKEEKSEEESGYKAGTAVTLKDGSNWYVMYQDNDMVTLLSSQYYGEKTGFAEEVNTYETSIVKQKIDTQFLPALTTSLSAAGGDVTGLTARIITVADIKRILNIGADVDPKTIIIPKEHKWMFELADYWTGTPVEGDLNMSVYVITTWVSFGSVDADSAGNGFSTAGRASYIRPVITTKVSNIKQ